MYSDSVGKTVMTLLRRDCPAESVPDLCGGNRKNSASDRKKSEGWYKETVGARGAERASTRHIGNAVEWSQIPGCSATENFVGQHGDLILLAPRHAANVSIPAHH